VDPLPDPAHVNAGRPAAMRSALLLFAPLAAGVLAGLYLALFFADERAGWIAVGLGLVAASAAFAMRAEGADLAVGKIDGDGASRAVAKFAALFGELVPPPPPAGGEAPDEIRRWLAHEVAYWVTGPWQVGALRDRERLAVSPLAHAPRGGQLLVVPACARRASDGWRLAAELTAVDVQRRFADAFATVPTRRAALDAASPLVHAIHGALASAEMLPRSPLTPLLFDDLNPALAAAVNGDATAEEVIEGVRRGWRRLAAARRAP